MNTTGGLEALMRHSNPRPRVCLCTPPHPKQHTTQYSMERQLPSFAGETEAVQRDGGHGGETTL